jgi:hypothetical protein
MGAADLGQHLRTGLGQDEDLRPAMARIVLEAAESLGDQLVGDALDALPLEPEPPGDVGHGRPAVLGRLQDHPPGVRLPGLRGDPFTGVAQHAIRFEQVVQCGVGFAHRSSRI